MICQMERKQEDPELTEDPENSGLTDLACLKASSAHSDKLQIQYARASDLLDEQIAKSNWLTRKLVKFIIKKNLAKPALKTIDTVTDTSFDVLQKL